MKASIILASQSTIRRKLLTNSGLIYDAVSSEVDEDSIKADCKKNAISIADTAMLLAKEKAKTVSKQFQDSFVIGADQILGLDGQAFDKPKSRSEVIDRLEEFSGKIHYLYTAVTIYKASGPVWEYSCAPALTVRELSRDEIVRYLAATGDEIMGSVGAYQLESVGVRLFSRIEGDYFSILGLPLLPLMAFFRDRDLLEF